MQPNKTIILGAGLSGCIAGIMNPDAVIFEAKSEESFMASPEHKAVLRFRSNKISQLTGIPFKEVQVRKSIWYQSKEHRFPDIRFTNMYSRKVVGGYFDRSIVNLDTVQRWLPPPDFHSVMLGKISRRVKFGCPVSACNRNYLLCRWEHSDEDSPISRDNGSIISTIAVPIMEEILNLPSPVSFSSGKKIYVVRFKIHNCNLNVSMYYPDPDFPVYRASIMCDVLSVEMIDKNFNTCTADEWFQSGILRVVMNSLGLDRKDLEYVDEGRQLGKINYDIDDRARKNWIVRLTIENQIYSLGRFAVWKNILQDDVYEDAKKISSYIESGTHYDFLSNNAV